MKIHKYQPGSFIEVDDMAGGRRVGMVCKDGVTFWDLLDSERCTPLTIHPSMNPQELGNLVQFSRDKGLGKATQALVGHMQAADDQRLSGDPLFVMRALWFVAKKRAVRTMFLMPEHCDGPASRPRRRRNRRSVSTSWQTSTAPLRPE